MKVKRKLLTALVLSTILSTTAFAANEPTNPITQTPSQSMTSREAANFATNYVVADQISKMKENGPDWLKRTDITIHFETHQKPTYSIETIQPIGVQSDRITNFTQFRIGNDLSAGAVMNIGFGHRVLSSDKTNMTGVNVFYDYGFRYGHARIGAGAEYFQGRNEYRANIYHAISGEKEVDKVNHIFEKALSGYDASITTSFANAPWAKIGVTAFHWDYDYSDDANGYKIFTKVQVTPRVHMELGYWDDNKGPGEKYVKVMYTLGDKTPAMFENGKKVFRNEDKKVTVESKRLDKVQRENDIKVERYGKNAGGNVTFTISR